MPAEPVMLEGKPALRPHREIDARWRYHAWLLALISLALLATALMEIHGDQQVTLPLAGPLPAACVWKSLWGTNCPGCGLTRSFVALTHADLAAAWRYNPAGTLIFAIAMYQIPFRSVQLWRLARGRADRRHRPWTIHLAVWATVTALIVQWLWRTVL
ncbi:MAG: DUF2752 domain-containing protein [Planctomycetales bacterium]|nr:DUF2752 domain-containing protein [Planctomycetales bacterium]NIM09758.1 DUF2752 domain-containing protein [Planctomycetales bacterium]NIN08283.1 DUF2752 domain-containing protein [Planctomycetales bacterium]NIN77412.1 DUF2752 domain-containing protein [Planctomycetales bacterium]NIO35020.1 DUF2752 domain-containing protein [Planctomycetales bacterium]